MKDKNWKGKRSHNADKRDWLKVRYPELFSPGKQSQRKKRKLNGKNS
jgi:hypothetical protein|tara:strand:+ start:757 stop:897 length:141 start_codon:yes stop_codon:yes gene_type:complete